MELAIGEQIHETEEALLEELRRVRRGLRGAPGAAAGTAPPLTLGQRIADTVASNMGSWRFIIIQTTILFIWIVLNVTAYVQRWILIPSSCSTSLCPSRRPMPRPSS